MIDTSHLEHMRQRIAEQIRTCGDNPETLANLKKKLAEYDRALSEARRKQWADGSENDYDDDY